ncbi:MAG: hypothetical protein AB8F34_01560 [Akkermansiaceae bacterium]
MLTDLLTSSKGPGVIGTFLAIIVLAGFGGLMVLVTDNSKGPGLATQIKDKKSKVNSLQEQIKSWQKASVEYKQRRVKQRELNSAVASLQRKKAQVKNTLEELEGKKGEIQAVGNKLEEYKKQYRIAERARAVGETMATLETKEGKVYEGVKIRKIDAMGINIQHKNGFTRVNYQHLPDEIQDRFQFSEEDAAALKKTETAVVQKSVQGGKQYKLARQILDRRTRLLAIGQDIAKFTSEVKTQEAEIAANEIAIKTATERAQYYRSLPNRGLNWDKAKKQEQRVDTLQKRTSRSKNTISSRTTAITKLKQEDAKLKSEISNIQRELNKLKKK